MQTIRQTFLLIAILLMATNAFGAAAITYPKFQAFDSNGDPLAGGKVYTYSPGTSTEKTSYSDRALSSANTNPIILDSRGECLIYGTGTYKIVVKDSDDVTIITVDTWAGLGSVDRVSVSDYADLPAAITAIGSTQKTLLIDTDCELDQNLTIPANVHLEFTSGSIISSDAARTLTINGSITAGDFQIFDISNSLDLAGGGNGWANVMWFGTAGDGTTDDTTEIQAAIEYITDAGGTVYFPSNSYRINDQVAVKTYVLLKGLSTRVDAAGSKNPTFNCYEGTDGTTAQFTFADSSGISGFEITYPTQVANTEATPTDFAWTFSISGNDYVTIENIFMENVYEGIYVNDAQRFKISNIYGQPLSVGMYIDNTTVEGSVIEHVKFWPYYAGSGDNLYTWVAANAIGCQIGKVSNLSVIGLDLKRFNQGLYMTDYGNGSAKANFVNCDVTECANPVILDKVSNTKFTNCSFSSRNLTGVVTPICLIEDVTGSLSFVNCSFWGNGSDVGVECISADNSEEIYFTNCDFDGPEYPIFAAQNDTSNIYMSNCEGFASALPIAKDNFYFDGVKYPDMDTNISPDNLDMEDWTGGSPDNWTFTNATVAEYDDVLNGVTVTVGSASPLTTTFSYDLPADIVEREGPYMLQFAMNTQNITSSNNTITVRICKNDGTNVQWQGLGDVIPRTTGDAGAAVANNFNLCFPIMLSKFASGTTALQFVITQTTDAVQGTFVLSGVRLWESNEENVSQKMIELLNRRALLRPESYGPVKIVSGENLIGWSNNAQPTYGPYTAGDIFWNIAGGSSAVPGWLCTNRQDTEMKVAAVATDTSLDVDSTASMTAGDTIGIELDNGSYHWTTISSITDADTLVIAVQMPSAAAIDNTVYTNDFDIVLGDNVPDSYDLSFGNGEDLKIYSSSDNGVIEQATSDKDIIFQVNDGGSANTEVMRIDGSEPIVRILDSVELTVGSGDDLQIYSSSDNVVIEQATSDKDIIVQVNDGGSANTEVMRIDGSTSNVGIGETSPDAKLTVNQGSVAGECISMKATGISHGGGGATIETDTYTYLQPSWVDAGGLLLESITDGDETSGAYAFWVRAKLRDTAETSTTTADPGVITIDGYQHDGANGNTAVADAGNLVAFRNQSSTTNIIKGNGTFHAGFAADDAKIAINEPSPDAFLTINQGADDGECISLKSSDVAHGGAISQETDTYGTFSKTWNDGGGLKIRGMTDGGETTGYGAIRIDAAQRDTADTTTTTAGLGIVAIIAQQTDGAGTESAVAADGNCFTVRNYDSTKFIVKGDGDIYYDGTDQGAYDKYDDMQLAEAARYSIAGWDKKVNKKYKKQLEDLGIMKGGMISNRKMTMLQLGSIGQLWKIIGVLAERLGISEDELLKIAKADDYNEPKLRKVGNE